jgi:RimJ/RimL family protein N-acetyltransferase
MPAFDEIELHTSRLRLRPLRDDDAPALLAIFSDARVMRHWSTPPWAGIDRAQAVIALDREALAAGRHLRLGLERLEDGDLLGTCMLFNFYPQCRRAELGFGLRSAAWGRGYMHEALAALLGHAFDALGLNRVEADTDPRNRAALSTLERVGFEREGLLRERWIVAGEVSDSAILGLLRSRWNARAAAGAAPGAC